MSISSKKSRILLLVVAFVGVGGGMWWYKASKNSLEPQKLTRAPVSVEVTPVVERSVGRRVSTNGVLVAAQSVNLCPEVEGRIHKILFRQGQKVKKGDLLIQLDDSVAQAKLREAQAGLAFARSEYSRTKQLFDKSFGNKAALEKAAAEVAIREASVLAASVGVDQTKIIAPFDGVVGLQNVSEGSTVTRNKELLSLVSMESLYVDFSVPDSYLKYLTIGDSVDVMVEGLDDLLGIECPIIAIDSQVRSSTHSITVRAEVRNDSEQMRPGQFARVTASFGQENNALLIPVVAVEKDTDQTYVYLIVHDTAVKTDLTLGMRDKDMVQVIDGVRKGDQVVVAGQIKLSDGMAVKVVRTDEASGKAVGEKSSTDAKPAS